MMEFTQTHQKHNVAELMAERREFDQMLNNLRSGNKSSHIESEGYSSGEIGEPKTEEAEAVEVQPEEVVSSSEDQEHDEEHETKK